MTLIAGCALFGSSEDSLRDDIVEAALDQVGEDYHYGGADPDDGFDCSGLVFYSYGKAGIKLPRSAAAQHASGHAVTFEHAKPADLLFYNFHDRKKGDPGSGPGRGLHVVLYLGKGKGVHAPVSGGEVEKIDVTEKQWRTRFIGARRIIREG